MQKPAKTFADYLVIAISPALIMLLVGSLAFFLIQVFYRGEMIAGIRWFMFWFVLAIVLVARIGVEQSKEQAIFYGAALALAAFFYLGYIHTDVVLGVVLLGITWWCAHLLTVDCTLIKEDEDASGEGVWENLWRTVEKSLEPPIPPGYPLPPTLGPRPSPLIRPPLPKLPPGVPLPKRRKPARPPGRWIVFFSLIALPLFGIGQLLLPADPEARRTGFEFLLLYLAAALSLLMTTSFLGMRRYLRQRFVEMSAPIAVGWVRFGVILAAAVLVLALVLPRPGATSTWHKLTYHISHKPHHASPYALVFNAPGEGNGSPSDQPTEQTGSGTDSHHGTSGGGNQNTQNPGNQSTTPANSGQSGNAGSGGQSGHGQGSGGAGSGSSGGNADSDGGGNGPGNSGGSGNVSTPQGSGTNPGGNNSPNGNNPGNGGGGSGGYDDGKDPEAPNGNFQHGSGADGSQAEKRPQNQNTPDEQTSQPSGQKPGGGNGPQGGNGNGNGPQGSGPSGNQPQPKPTPGQKPNVAPQQPPTPQPQQKPGPKEPHQIDWQRVLLILFLIALAALLVWLVVHYRRVIAHAFRSFVAAVREFFRNLFSFRRRKRSAPEQIPLPAPPAQPFSTFENPFLNGKASSWPPKRLILYTYEAIRGWAKDQRIEMKPQETPREFCLRLCQLFPDFAPDLQRFSYLYGYAAFADELPDDYDSEPIHFLWTYMGDSVMAISSG